MWTNFNLMHMLKDDKHRESSCLFYSIASNCMSIQSRPCAPLQGPLHSSNFLKRCKCGSSFPKMLSLLICIISYGKLIFWDTAEAQLFLAHQCWQGLKTIKTYQPCSSWGTRHSAMGYWTANAYLYTQKCTDRLARVDEVSNLTACPVMAMEGGVSKPDEILR